MNAGLAVDRLSATLATKLLRPRTPPDLVARPTLLGRIEHGLDLKLTLIAAPAGYGKTTLIGAWLRQTNRPVAYLALDPYDADAPTFVPAFVMALRSVAPEFGRDTLTLVRLPQLPPMGQLARTLAAELAAL